MTTAEPIAHSPTNGDQHRRIHSHPAPDRIGEAGVPGGDRYGPAMTSDQRAGTASTIDPLQQRRAYPVAPRSGGGRG